MMSARNGIPASTTPRTIARLALAAGLVFAGVSHLYWARKEFRSQVPPWVPFLLIMWSSWRRVRWRSYRSLAQAGIRWLVCLEERCEYAIAQARAHDITHLHFPVPDMAPPSFNQAVDLCRHAEDPIRNNQGLALHCRAGLGRTGTALALILVWFGDAADAAVAKVRRANPMAIQSEAQLRFVYDFANRIRGWHLPSNTYEEKSNVVR